jgi:cob(I)alamin adenosyltransferase
MSPQLADLTLVRTHRHVTYEAAAEVVRAGVQIGRDRGLSVTVVVTDVSGGVVAAGRLDGAHARTLDFARGKATYSAASGKTTAWFVEHRLEPNEVLWKALSEDPATFLVPGGMPLHHGGQSVGGVGVSGGAYHEDVIVAEACAAHWDALLAGGEVPDEGAGT